MRIATPRIVSEFRSLNTGEAPPARITIPGPGTDIWLRLSIGETVLLAQPALVLISGLDAVLRHFR
jgi:hypothetical protein